MSWRRISSAGLAFVLIPSCSPGGKNVERLPPPAAAPASTRTQPTAPTGKIAARAPAAPRQSLPTEPAKETTPGPATPDALVDQAEKIAISGNLDEAIRLLEQALAVQQDHRKALFLLARLAQEGGNEKEQPAKSSLYIQSARAIRKLRDTYKDLSPLERQHVVPLLYNEACSYALEGQPEKALDALADAIEAGFDQPEQVATDDDLVSIRKTPRFAELRRKLDRNLRERDAAAAKSILAQTTSFPFRFELLSLDGKKVALDDLKGNVILVDFWGTWCPVCRKELPSLEQLLAKYRDQGLTIVGINYERVPDVYAKDTIKQFIKEHRVSFPCLVGDATTRNQIADFVYYPTLLFLDRSRKVRAKVVGDRSFAELEAIVLLLLAETPKTN